MMRMQSLRIPGVGVSALRLSLLSWLLHMLSVGCNADKSASSGGITVSGVPSGASSSLTVSPAFGPLSGGTKLTIYGSKFDNTTTVTLGGLPCSGIQVASDSNLTCYTPAASSPGAVDVTANLQSGTTSLSAPKSFTYLDKISVDSISPEVAPVAGNIVLTITGTGFSPNAVVDIGGQPCSSVAVVPPTTMRCTLAPAARPGGTPVTVKGPDGQSAISGKLLTFKATPTISGVSPSSGNISGGNVIRLFGTGFDASAKVLIGGVPCTDVQVLSSTGISCTVPASTAATRVPITIMDALDQSGSLRDAYTYRTAPTIASVSPTTVSTYGGDLVTITGANLRETTAVSIGAAACTAQTLVNQTTIVCTTPPGFAGPANVVVRNDDGQSVTLANGLTFAAPVLSANSIGLSLGSISPSTGLISGGGMLVLNGTGFSQDMVVKIGANTCTNLAISASNRATCTVPAGTAGVKTVSVEISGAQASLGNGYIYLLGQSPSITGVVPNFGPTAGNTLIRVSGSGFTAGTTVTIGGMPCSSVTVDASGEFLTCRTPAGTFGAKDVLVTAPDTQTALRTGGFSYGAGAAPSVGAVSPSYGPPDASTTITITGSNFQSGAIVTINNLTCTNVTVVSSSSLTCSTPLSSYGLNRTVTVTNPDGAAASLTNAFSWSNGPAPTVVTISPNYGPAAGGSAVTITGSNFATAGAISPQVTINGLYCTNVRSVTSNSLTCDTPASAYALNRTVAVINPDGQSGTLASAYSWSTGPSPVVATVSPNFGPAAGGTAITITGSNFITAGSGASQVLPQVTINGLYCTSVRNVTTTSITCDTPASTYGLNRTVAVINPDGQQGSLGNAFSWSSGPAPTISAVSPNFGLPAGGTAITITGSNFATVGTGGAAVLPQVIVAGLYCTNVRSVTATSLVCDTPASFFGLNRSITVINPDGQSATMANAFSYSNGLAPTVTGVSPNFGPAAGGTTITLTGSNFVSGAVVFVAGIACTTSTWVSPTSMECVTPPGAFSSTPNRTVAVTNPDGQQGSLANSFFWSNGLAPSISSVYPPTGPITGGTTLYVSGANFVSGAFISVGAVNCATTTFVTSTLATCVVPAGTAGTATVRITNPDGQNASVANTFTYLVIPSFVYTVTGTVDSVRLGSAVTGIPDLNADATNDFAVAAPYATVGGVTAAGQVYVYSGRTGALICALQSPNPVTNGYFGSSLAAGSIDADTQGDLVIGEPGQTVSGNTGAGVAYVFAGSQISGCTSPLSTVLYTLQSGTPGANANFGWSVAAGNVSGAAAVDIVVGEPFAANGGIQRGRVTAFTGSTGASLYSITSPGTADLGLFGYAVAVADMNGDGKGDIVVGEPGAANGGTMRGRVYAISGADGSTQVFSTGATGSGVDNARFGFAVANAGLVNSDARQDIVVGEPYYTNGANIAAGRVYIIGYLSGATSTTIRSIDPVTVEANSLFGYSVASAGDVDGDGRSDIIVGHPYLTASGSTNRGRVVVYSGAAASMASSTALYTVDGRESYALLGRSVAPIGDINGDGFSDIIFGEPLAPSGGVNRGRAYVYAAP